MPTKSNWTIPNLITIGRIILVPVFAVMFITEQFGVALSLFLIAGLSDGLDGYLARVLNQGTRLGAMMDPLADKLLLVTAYACLGVVGLLPGWLVVLVISRELVIFSGMALLHFKGVEVQNRIQPTMFSKFNTGCQIILIVLSLATYSLGLPWLGLVQFLVATVAATTILSGVQYFSIGIGHYRASKEW